MSSKSLHYTESRKAEGMSGMVHTKRNIQTVFFAMGTVCSVTVYDERDKSAADSVKERVRQLHDRLNAYDAQSEIARVNQNAGECFTEVSEDALRLLRRKGQRVYRFSAL